MVREGEGIPFAPRAPPKIARAQQPDFGHRNVVGHGANALEGMIGGKPWSRNASRSSSRAGKSSALERFARAAQRQGGERIGARRAAEPEIDAAGMQRLQHAKVSATFSGV